MKTIRINYIMSALKFFVCLILNDKGDILHEIPSLEIDLLDAIITSVPKKAQKICRCVDEFL